MMLNQSDNVIVNSPNFCFDIKVYIEFLINLVSETLSLLKFSKCSLFYAFLISKNLSLVLDLGKEI